MRKLLAVALVLWAGVAQGHSSQGFDPAPSCTMANMLQGRCGSNAGDRVWVVDASTATSCATGGGSFQHECVRQVDGSWSAPAGGSADVSSLGDSGNLCSANQVVARNAGDTAFTCVTGGAGGMTPADIDTSAELAAIITNETGTGAIVFANSPTLIAPVLGTVTSGDVSNVTGNATGLTAGFAGALSANPTDCAANTWANAIAANGNLTCAVISGGAGIADGSIAAADLSANYAASVSAGGPATTATALAANPTNCSAGNYPLGIDAAGNVESCTAAGGGATGVDDNDLVRANGTGGALEGTNLSVSDDGGLVLPHATASGNPLDNHVKFTVVPFVEGVGSPVLQMLDALGYTYPLLSGGSTTNQVLYGDGTGNASGSKAYWDAANNELDFGAESGVQWFKADASTAPASGDCDVASEVGRIVNRAGAGVTAGDGGICICGQDAGGISWRCSGTGASGIPITFDEIGFIADTAWVGVDLGTTAGECFFGIAAADNSISGMICEGGTANTHERALMFQDVGATDDILILVPNSVDDELIASVHQQTMTNKTIQLNNNTVGLPASGANAKLSEDATSTGPVFVDVDGDDTFDAPADFRFIGTNTVNGDVVIPGNLTVTDEFAVTGIPKPLEQVLYRFRLAAGSVPDADDCWPMIGSYEAKVTASGADPGGRCRSYLPFDTHLTNACVTIVDGTLPTGSCAIELYEEGERGTIHASFDINSAALNAVGEYACVALNIPIDSPASPSPEALYFQAAAGCTSTVNWPEIEVVIQGYRSSIP